MRIAWISGVFVLFLVGSLIGKTIEAEYLGTGTTDVFAGLMLPPFGEYTNVLLAVGGFFITAWNWVRLIWVGLSWDYAFLTGVWEIFRYVGWAISIGVITALVLALRGTSSS